MSRTKVMALEQNIEEWAKHLKGDLAAARAPEPADEAAEAVRQISEGIRKLMSGSLTEAAIIVLIQHTIPQKERPTIKQIKSVLDAAAGLDRKWLKKGR